MNEDRPTEWFEPLYRDTDTDGSGVPWANMETHPHFSAWLERSPIQGKGLSALVVGCGMGDDAVELASRGFAVTAFDVSSSAIDHCRRRFVDSGVDWGVADLLNPPLEWYQHFNFVLEIYTIQALPPAYEAETIARIADFVAEGGLLLAIAIVGDTPRSFEAGPPWILTPGFVDTIQAQGLDAIDQTDDLEGAQHGGVSIATFQRPRG